MTYRGYEHIGLTDRMESIIDTMIAGSLVNENRMRYNLRFFGQRICGHVGKNEKIII